MAKLGKRSVVARAAFEGRTLLAVDEAVKLIKAAASAKFDETLEISMNLGVDPRHADQMVRGVVQLPNGTGKTVRVAVFARAAKADEAKAEAATIIAKAKDKAADIIADTKAANAEAKKLKASLTDALEDAKASKGEADAKIAEAAVSAAEANAQAEELAKAAADLAAEKEAIAARHKQFIESL
jgi:hypothetical protein